MTDQKRNYSLLLALGILSIFSSCVGSKPERYTLATEPDGKAILRQGPFFVSYSVKVRINADVSTVWRILLDAPAYSSWNSTIISIDGDIGLGEKIQLRSTVDSSRVFKLKVTNLDTNSRMIWKSGIPGIFRGVREYTLKSRPDGSTEFAMTEVLAGYALLFAKKSLPDFRPSFEAIAADLKKEAEE